jgi:hypothetical protein
MSFRSNASSAVLGVALLSCLVVGAIASVKMVMHQTSVALSLAFMFLFVFLVGAVFGIASGD